MRKNNPTIHPVWQATAVSGLQNFDPGNCLCF